MFKMLWLSFFLSFFLRYVSVPATILHAGLRVKFDKDLEWSGSYVYQLVVNNLFTPIEKPVKSFLRSSMDVQCTPLSNGLLIC